MSNVARRQKRLKYLLLRRRRVLRRALDRQTLALFAVATLLAVALWLI